MHTKNMFRRILLVIFGITALHCGEFLADTLLPGMSSQGPSLDDIKAMEAEIDNFVKTLPPEQQKQFYKDVEELTGIMEKMSPDELNEFVGSVFTDAGLIEAAPMPAKKPEVKPETPRKEEAKPAVVVTTAASGPTEKAIAMINKIIERTQEFMRKAQIIPELQAKMDKWVVQKKLLEVTAKLDWETVEVQIDELNTLLYMLKQQDPVTHHYKHIGNLIKDEALYNNLATLQVTLDAYVPLIYAPDFGLEKVSKESRAAIREVISQYLESFYLLNVPAAIKKVQLLYAPREKELLEQEKKLAEQAKKDAEKARVPAPAQKSVGTTPAYTPPYHPSSYDYSSGYGNSGYGYSPSSSYSPSYSPSSYDYSPTGSSSATPSSKAPSAGGSSSSGKSEGAKEGKQGGKSEGGNEAEAATPGKDGKPAAAKEEIKEDHALNLKINRMPGRDIEYATDALKGFEGEMFTKFSDYFRSGKDFEPAFITDKLESVVKAIAEANKQLKQSTDNIKKFKDELKPLNKPTQDFYKKSLASYYKELVKFYQKLHEDMITVAQVKDDPRYAPEMSSNKRYVYYGQDTPSDDVKKKVPTAPAVTMDKLDETIQAFLQEAK